MVKITGKTNKSEIANAIQKYNGTEIIYMTWYNKGYIKLADGSIYTYEYENGIVIIKDIGSHDVKNIIQVQE